MADVQLTVQVSQPNRVDVTLDSPNIVQVQQAAPTRLEVIQGVSLPAGGNVNQVLTKLSNTNFDYIWTTPAAGGGGTVSNLSNGAYQLALAANGELIFPDGATYSDGTLTINSSYAINAASEINSFLNWRTANQSGVQIYNDGVNIFANEPTQVGWKFNSTGELVFPNSTRQNTAWLGYDPNSSSAFNKANSANLVAVSAFAAANVAAQTVPQNAQTGVYALQRSDAGKHIYYTQATSTILYIPTTANVAFANGTTIMLISRTTSSANVTVTPNSGVTMYLAGNTTSASRNLTTYGIATLIQVASNTWMIYGTGVV